MSALGSVGSTAVTQPRSDAVHRQENSALGVVVGVARAITPQSFDLQMIERVDVRHAVAQAAGEK